MNAHIQPLCRADAASDYRLGALYALTTALLLAAQEPFSVLAARRLRSLDFLAVTQVALLVAIPVLLLRPGSRGDFVAILTQVRHWPKLIVLLGVGCAGLLLYDVALSSTHPIIAAAVLNLSPFWAALVSRLVDGKGNLRSPAVFVGCLAVAFAGAMMVAISQIETDASTLTRDLVYSLFHRRWALAIPMPVFFALSGALVYKWFRAYDEGAAVAANFLVSAAALIPVAAFFAHGSIVPPMDERNVSALLLLLIGTLASSASGRIFYQLALKATQNDNGFVTMFFLAIPVLSAILTWPLSFWIPGLTIRSPPSFWIGMALVTAPLVVFSKATIQKR